MANDTLTAPPAREALPPAPVRPFASYFPSELLVRITQHFHAYGQVREQGRALSRRLIETNTVYDLPAAKAIERQLADWADGADRLLADVKASGEADDLRPWTTQLRDTLLDVRLTLQIPVERAAAIQERIAREGLTGTTTFEDLLRERLQHHP